jgi:hypothetical protein
MPRKADAWTRVRALAARLPAVDEGTSYGTPALHVRKRLLSRLKEDGETITLATTFVERDLLVADRPDAFFFTDHYRDYPIVLVRVARLDDETLGTLLEDAWRRLAPKTVVAGYDAAR